MKPKVMTRAMSVFLAVVLSFSLIIPYTFAEDDENVDAEEVSTEILYEPVEDEDTEDETELAEPTEVVKADENDFEVDIVLENYIRDNADESYVGEVNKMAVYNALPVKNTMFDGSLVKKTDTIDSIMYSIEDSEDEVSMSKLIAQLDATVALYDVNEDSEYLVGMANTMKDSQSYVQDYCVAEYNANGIVVDGCHYDYDTGLVYIPKDLYYSEDGSEYSIGSIQIQLMQVLTADTGDMTSDVESSTFDDDSATVYDITEEIFALETTVQVDTGLDEDDIVVAINGIPVTEDDYDYDSATGELVIDESSASIQTVSVTSGEDANYDIQTYGSVSSYDDMSDYNSQNEIALPNWMTTGTALYGYAPVAYAESGFDPGSFTPGDSYVYTGDYYNDCQALYNLITQNLNSSAINASDLEIAPTQYVCVALDNDYRLCRTGSGTDEQWYLGNSLAYYNNIGGVPNTAGGSVSDGTIASGISYLGTIYLECCHISRDANGNDWFTNMSGDNYNVSNPNDSAQEQIFMWKPAMLRCLAMGTDSKGTYAVFGVYTGAIALQNGIAVFKVHTTSSDGKIAVQKTSTNATLTSENNCYSLEGAVYGVFTDYSTAQSANKDNYKSTAYTTITTKADGSSDFVTVPGGTYYVKEVVASPGHELDETIYSVAVGGEAGLRDLHQDSNGNWYVYLDGVLDTKYTGLFSNQYGTWYVENGKVNFSYNKTFNGGDVEYDGSKNPIEDGWEIDGGKVVDGSWCTLTTPNTTNSGANQNNVCIIDDNAYSGRLIVGDSRMTQLYEAGQYGTYFEFVHDASFVTCWGGNYWGNDSGSINSSYNVGKMKQFVQESLDYVGYCNVYLELTVNGIVDNPTGMVDNVISLANELSQLSSTFYGNTVYPTIYIMTAVKAGSAWSDYVNLNNACDTANNYLYGRYDNDLIINLGDDLIDDTTHQDPYLSDGLHFSDTSLIVMWEDIKAHFTSTTIVGESEETVYSEELAETDPLGLEIVKISEDEDLTDPLSMAGAQFTIKYYDGYYNSISSLPSAATRTWVLETKEVDGAYYAGLFDSYKVSGDDLYKDSNNVPYLPLGTITIEETKAPEGYTTEGSYLITSNHSEIADSDGVLLLQVNEDLYAEGGASLNSGNHSYTKYDTPIRGGVAVYKYDPETVNLMDNPQGDADLAGATFAIKSLNNYQVKVDGKAYTYGEIVKTIDTEKIVYDDGSYNYYAYTDIDTLPYGNYEIYETDPSTGYMIPGTNYDFTFKIERNLEYHTYDLNGNKIEVGNDVMRGGVGIYKYDIETYQMMTTPQGDGDLAGAEFTLYNRSKNPVYVDGQLYQPDEVIMTLVTQRYSDGTHNWYYAGTDDDALPYGSYELIETKASEGYLIGDTYDYTFSIDYDGDFEMIDITPSHDGNVGQFNIVKRGGMEIMKRDLESGLNIPEGGASLAGAEFTIYNESIYPVLVNGKLVWPEGETNDKGEVSDGIVMVLVTNEDGYATTGEYALPYGSYKVVETLAPEGYLPHDQHKENTKDDGENVGVLERTFKIREDGEMVDMTDRNHTFDKDNYEDSAQAGRAIYNQVIRADFAIRKINDEQHTMANVMFKITSNTTGETHYFKTDENGGYSSAVDYAKHDYETNYYDDEDNWDNDMTDHVGMWFYGYADPETTKVDNRLGALPYDSYTIEEIRTEANENYTLWTDTFVVGPEDNNIVIDMNDIEDKYVVLSTYSEFDATDSKYAPTSGSTIVEDEVSYQNLTVGQEYTLVAKLYDLTTQNFVTDENGDDWMGMTVFTARMNTGIARTEFTFDSTGLDGHDVVVFEYLYEGTDLETSPYVWEADPTEADQTLHFPGVETTALDEETGKHMVYADDSITIIDTVEYTNLIPGREYTLTGTLMDKDTGEPALDINGNEITATKTFTPDEAEGIEEVEFTFDGTMLEGTVMVVFEHIYYKGVEYAAHTDIDDDEQTIYLPKVHTMAWTDETGTNLGVLTEEHETTKLYDTVWYSGVQPDQDYHIFGVLLDAETREAEVDADGNEIYGDYGPFTVYEPSGEEIVEYNVDTSQLAGRKTVFFEVLYHVTYDEETGEPIYELVAEEDIAEAEQESLYFPDIHTNAYGKDTEEGVIGTSEETVLIDTITYTHLAPDHEYTVTGVLMNKETGEPILDAEGNEITSEASFTPDTPEGTVDVEFVFDTTGMEGTTIVVFEDLYYEEIELAVHADIDDEDQSVYIPDVHTTALGEDTNEHMTEASEEIKIVDTVDYTNLKPGVEYTLTGVLMDKETGEAILDDEGNEVTAETVFTPDEADGSVEIEFIFSGVSLAGKSVVAFESVTYNEIEVAAHADIDDMDQTVDIPEIHTTAIDSDTLDHISMADDSITIVDTVEYTNLIPDKEYTMTGTLMDKETGEAVLTENGEAVTAETTFTPEEADGSVEIAFTFAGTSLAGKTLVAFESVTYEDVEVAVHADIDDEAQTVYVPQIHTTAVAESTGAHEVETDGTVTIIDTVDYTNLLPGQTYTMKGELMDELTGSALNITAETEFVPETADGSVEMTFTFDANSVGDTTVVVFEECYLNTAENGQQLVAEHKDMNDTNQQVKLSIPVKETTTTSTTTPTQSGTTTTSGVKTGEIIGFSVLAAVIVAAGVVLIVTVTRRKKSGEEN